MAKEILISTTPHETRLAILEDDQLAEIYYERENEYTLAGSIYKGRVTRVLPGMQSSFVDVGLERDAFLYVTDFLEDSEDGEDYETSNIQSPSRRTSLPSASEESASDQEQGERAGRRDGRRGDRGSKGERGRAERPAPALEAVSPQPAAAPSEPNRRQRVAGERAAVNEALRTAQPTFPDLEEKEDEETPDGTRRWRGRRGRRRGGMRAGVLGDAPKTMSSTPAPAEQEAFDVLEHGAPGGTIAPVADADFEPGEAETLDLHAAASPVAAAPVAMERGGRERQPRADRGGRDRAERTPRETHGGRPAFAVSATAPEAIVLPGESLLKYGAAPASQSAPKAAAKLDLPQRPVNYTPPRPASLVESVSGWDGGAVLPGETLSRHRSAAAPAPQLPANLHEEHLLIPVQPNIVAAAPMPVEGEPVPTETPATDSAHTDDAEQGAELGAEARDAAAVEDTPEFEPTEGSASVRVSPVTSELRFSQLFGGRTEPTPEPAQEPAPRATDSQQAPAASSAQEPLRSTLQAGTQVATEWTTEPNVEPNAEPNAKSKPFETYDPEAEEEASIHLSAIHAEQKTDGFSELVDQLQGFAPGSGLLEEEVIDEDEYDFDPIHAHGDDHDLEEIEEETLDGAFAHPSAHAEEAEASSAARAEGSPRSSERSREHFGEREGRSRSGRRAKAARTASPVAPQEHGDDEPFAPFSLQVIDPDMDDEQDGEQDCEPGFAPGGEAPSRERSSGEAGRRGGRNGGRRRGMTGGSRRSAQTQDLPIISDLLKPGQEILIQIAKEPIAKKGARITSHIALPGRFLVFMPTVSHVGVSRKIASDEERQRLKRILISEKGDSAGGFIVRTAAEGANEEELRADLRFLISLWTEIKQRADTAKAPALIYHDLNLVERILRDQVSSNFSTIWVDTEVEYERIVRFLNRFQPSLVRRVKLYTKETPLFEHFGIQDEISKALKAKVWLKSGGSIVINQTEALVAIDINTGKYVGKTARLEDTIVKTNLDAIPEIVRQIRLRDLGGIIIIDFIDMDERKNRHRVLAALEEAMKVDRAPSKVLQFNDFGLVAITRKRVKQSLERTLSVQCDVCSGTGMVKSPVTVCNEIFIEMRKMQKHLDGKDVMLRVHPEVVKQLKGSNGRWINEYEEMVGKTIIIKSDPSLHPEQFDIH